MLALLCLSRFALSTLLVSSEERDFVSWMRDQNVIYTGDEYHLRLGIFIGACRYVSDFNRDPRRLFRVSVNKFAALTPAEYRSRLGLKMKIDSTSGSTSPSPASSVAPASVDWREAGAVNPVKDQGQCGSCWAFSVVQTAESQWFIKKGQLLTYSESNLVDCVWLAAGCNGGNPTIAIEHVVFVQGGKWNSETDYPYVPETGSSCKFDSSKGIGHVSSYVSVKWGSESDLAEKVANYGPASISIDASMYSFQYYTSGIYDEEDCSTWLLDHAVGCVGYGTEGEKDFWIVRNSWGPTWGEQGYIRILRNAENKCGVATSGLVAVI